MFGIILLFLCDRSSVSSRWAGFAIQPNGVTGFAIRIIMYWNETAWMAIKNKLLRYTIDDGKTRHTKPLTFTGKERDEETGFGYFGARYMDHELMTMWLSVDPMADKYPSISPYAYCVWNPVKLVDPDGKDTAFASEEARKLYIEYREKVFGDDKFKSIQSELVAIERADDVFCIRTGKDVSSSKDGLIYNNKTNQFDINIGDEVNYGYSFSLLEKLSHELKHVDQYLNKKLGYDRQTHSFIGYSLRDEIEAYQRQGLFGKTIESTDEIRECYKRYRLSCPRVNRQIRLSSAQMEMNNQFVNSGHIPRYLYGGWQNDYKIEQIQ